MSFTEDELQAFTTILEQRFVVHRQEMEQVIDQRISDLRRDVDQMLTKSGDQKVQQTEAAIDRMLAVQLLGIEQLLNQSMSLRALERYPLAQAAVQPQLEAIEVQTEFPWEDLVATMGKALDERLALMNTSLQHSMKDLEQYLTLYLRGLRDEIGRSQGHGPHYSSSLSNTTSAQEILDGIEQLEHILESMQVAMTANHALLSNRLYHHQQLPLERAHPAPYTTPSNGVNSLLAQAKERIAQGQEPEFAAWQKESEEARGQ